MEERYNAINSLISAIAACNPYISEEQITRAKAMYNGDPRPLEVIEKELLAYSKEIRAKKEERAYQPDANNTVQVINNNDQELLPRERPSIEDNLIGSLSVGEQESELTEMLRNYDVDVTNKNNAEENNQVTDYTNKPKQMIKTMDSDQSQVPTRTATAGYSGAATLCALFSLMAIIIALAVVFAK